MKEMSVLCAIKCCNTLAWHQLLCGWTFNYMPKRTRNCHFWYQQQRVSCSCIYDL